MATRKRQFEKQQEDLSPAKRREIAKERFPFQNLNEFPEEILALIFSFVLGETLPLQQKFLFVKQSQTPLLIRSIYRFGQVSHRFRSIAFKYTLSPDILYDGPQEKQFLELPLLSKYLEQLYHLKTGIVLMILGGYWDFGLG